MKKTPDPFEDFDETAPKSKWVRLPSKRAVQVPVNPSDDVIDVLSEVEGIDLRKHPGFMKLVRDEPAADYVAQSVQTKTPDPGQPGSLTRGLLGGFLPNADAPSIRDLSDPSRLLQAPSPVSQEMPRAPGLGVLTPENYENSIKAAGEVDASHHSKESQITRILEAIANAEVTPSDTQREGFSSQYDVLPQVCPAITASKSDESWRGAQLPGSTKVGSGE